MVNVLPQVGKLRRTALELIFPSWCVGCGREGSYICPVCRRSLIPIEPDVCPRCGKSQTGGALCTSCAAAAAELDGIRAPFRFEGVLRKAIHEFKYRNLRAMAAPLAAMLAGCLNDKPLPADVLVPVPLHRRRLRERGYNQAGLLARELGKLTGLPVADGSLVRCQHTVSQVRTGSVEERRENVAGAFDCRGRFDGRRVLLIDDVTTSGATLNAGAGVLKSAGAAAVWGLVVAADI